MPPKIPPLNRQRSCPCIFFSGPVATPALRRVGLGHLEAIDSPRASPRNGCRHRDRNSIGLIPRRINSAYGWRMLNARIPFLSASHHPILKHADGCAGGCDGKGSAPAPPRFSALGPPAWGVADIRHNMPTPETSDRMLPPPWRIRPSSDSSGTVAPSAGPYGTIRRPRTPPALLHDLPPTPPRQHKPPPLLAAPMR